MSSKIIKIILTLFLTVCIAGHGEASEKTAIFIQLGHSQIVLSVALSPDGKFIASADTDLIIIWEAATGRELISFNEQAKSLAFSPDGKHLLMGGKGGLKLIDTNSWKVNRELRGKGDEIRTVFFTFDGKFVVSEIYDLMAKNFGLKVWDWKAGREVRTYPGERVKVTPDRKYIYDQEKFKIFEISTGRELPALKNLKHVRYLTFSPGGERAIDSKWDVFSQVEIFTLYDLKSGEKIHELKMKTRDGGFNTQVLSHDGRYMATTSGSDEYAKSICIWDLQEGKKIKDLDGTISNFHEGASFSPDGKYLIVRGSMSKEDAYGFKDVLMVWDIATGRRIAVLKHKQGINTFASDARRIVTGSYDKTIKLWDIATGAETRTFKGEGVAVNAVAYSPDGRFLASAMGNGTVQLWDTANGSFVRTLKGGHTGSVQSVAFSPDGRLLLTGGEDKTLKLWDLDTGGVQITFSGHLRPVRSIAFSPDGALAASGGWVYLIFGGEEKVDDNVVRIWDTATGGQIRTLAGHTGLVFSVAFSPDGRYILSGSRDGTLKLWDANDGREIRTYTGISAWASQAIFSPDARYIAAGSGSGEAYIFEISSGRMVHKFKVVNDWVLSVAFSTDGRYFATGDAEGAIILWDVLSGKEVQRLKGHRQAVWSLAWSKDGKWLTSGALDGTIRFWDASSGKEKALLAGFSDGEWIAVSSDGYYNASVTGDQHLNVRLGNQVYGIDRYRPQFYKPEIIAALFGGQAPDIRKSLAEDKPATVEKAVDFLPPVVVIGSPVDGSDSVSDNIEIQVSVKSAHPLDKYEVFVNGNQVLKPDERGVTVKAKATQGRISRSFNVPLAIGRNTIIVKAYTTYAFSEDRIVVTRTGIETASVQLPELYLLAIGVGKYQYFKKEDQLNYSAGDAAAIADTFKKMEGVLFRKVNVRLIADMAEVKPTSANIIDSLGFLQKAGQHDVAILFIAGHGIRDGRGSYFFLPSDARMDSDGQFRLSTLVKWSDIREAIDIPSRVVAFLDTCHSGALFRSGKYRSIDKNKIIRELVSQGTLVFSSSTGEESAQESDAWGHGAFTWALLKGLGENKADFTKDGYITMKELDTFVSSEVPAMTKGAQHPVSYTPEGYRDFPLWKVK